MRGGEAFAVDNCTQLKGVTLMTIGGVPCVDEGPNARRIGFDADLLCCTGA